MERVRAELLLQGDLASAARCSTSGPSRRPRDEEGLYSCDGPAQFLVDVCLGRDAPDRAPAELGDPDGRGDGGGVAVGALARAGADRCPPGERRSLAGAPRAKTGAMHRLDRAPARATSLHKGDICGVRQALVCAPACERCMAPAGRPRGREPPHAANPVPCTARVAARLEERACTKATFAVSGKPWYARSLGSGAWHRLGRPPAPAGRQG